MAFTPTGPEDRGHTWLARSFRTAEQFVLQRAAAMIVHSSTAYRGALERGLQALRDFPQRLKPEFFLDLYGTPERRAPSPA